MLIIDPPNPVIQQSSIHSDLAAIIDTEKRVTVLLFFQKKVSVPDLLSQL